jgi:hypothetical protein
MFLSREYHRAKEDSRLAQNNFKNSTFHQHAKRKFQHSPKCIRTIIGLHPVNAGSEYQLIKCEQKDSGLDQNNKKISTLGQDAKKRSFNIVQNLLGKALGEPRWPLILRMPSSTRA